MTDTQSHKGKFVWYEYMGNDLDAAVDFYKRVVPGWTMSDSGMTSFPYKIASVGSHGVAGFLTIPEPAKAMGAPPCWTGYIWVEDVDAALPELEKAGGSLKNGPMDIPGIGRFAVVADPYGAMFTIFRDASSNPNPAPAPDTEGMFGWRELHAGDGKGALDFYISQFGWKKESEFDMGSMGVYHLFHTGFEQGGIMTKAPQVPGPFWLYYIHVDALDAAIERIKANGGNVAHGPTQVPGGQWVVQAIDPQGGFFALVASKR